MSIPTKSEWQKLRDGAGGKLSEIKGYSVGKGLDAYHAALAKSGISGTIRPLADLDKGLKSYLDSVKKSNPKLAAVVQSKLIVEVDKAEKEILEVGKLAAKIGATVDQIEKAIKVNDWEQKDPMKVAALFKVIRATVDEIIDMDNINRWAQIHRMTVLAFGDLEKLAKEIKKPGPNTEKLVKHTEKTVIDSCKAIDKHLKG